MKCKQHSCYLCAILALAVLLMVQQMKIVNLSPLQEFPQAFAGAGLRRPNLRAGIVEAWLDKQIELTALIKNQSKDIAYLKDMYRRKAAIVDNMSKEMRKISSLQQQTKSQLKSFADVSKHPDAQHQSAPVEVLSKHLTESPRSAKANVGAPSPRAPLQAAPRALARNPAPGSSSESPKTPVPATETKRTLAEIGRDTVKAILEARKSGMPKNDQGGIATINSINLLDVSIDAQMRRWPAPKAASYCNTLWGWESAELWRQGKSVICGPEGISEGNSSRSYVVAYHRKMHRHAVQDTFVDGHNIAVTFRDLSMKQNPDASSWPSKTYSDRSFNPTIKPSKGSIRANCNIERGGGANWERFDQIRNWFGTGADRGAIVSVDNLDCSESVNHTVLITSRDGHANIFHSHEDMFNAWIVMSTLDIPMRGLQHYFTDGYPKEPLLAIWQNLLGDPSLDVLGGYELGKKFEDAHYTCYKRVVWNMPGIASPWATLIGSQTKCRGCPLYKSYAYSIMSRLGSANLESKTFLRYPPPMLSPPSAKPKLRVTWITRHIVEHPSKTFCDDEFFKCELYWSEPPRKLGRILKNEESLIKQTKTKYSNEMEVNVPPLAEMPVLEQLKLFSGTDLMIGPHGAGLTYILFTPDNAGLIELFIDGSGVNQHFHNAAFFADRKYWSIPNCPNPLPLNTFSITLEKVLKGLGSGVHT